MCLILHLAVSHCFKSLEVLGPVHTDVDIMVCEPPRGLQGNSHWLDVNFWFLSEQEELGKQ